MHPPPNTPAEHFDVLIIGAGLSGIGAAVHLQARCPDRSYAILEGRDAIGGTWDLFRYPGIRSDSDMYTLGYAFKPWQDARSIADGPSILRYVREAAREHAVERHIRFGHRVTSAAWSTGDATWTVEVAVDGGDGTTRPARFTCNFLFLCAGYYRYDQGYTPDFAGIDDFRGRVVHPQHWPEGLDVAGQRIVVIGSGATAVTLVPALAAQQAAHVTMLQRSPTWVVARPAEDRVANALRRMLPERLAHAAARWKQVLLGMYFYNLCRRQPARAKKVILAGVRAWLPGVDIDTHFTPHYDPWTQRLCLVPDGDLFRALRSGRASVVTDRIERFTASGVRLASGAELEADIVVTATGLVLQVLGGLTITVDGRAIDPAQTLTYKGMMSSGVPNLASAMGYTNASWTLKSDLTAEYVCRLLNRMKARGLRQCTPHEADPAMPREPWIDFSSGYFQRSIHLFPKQGSKPPWRLHQNYARDLLMLRYGSLDDGAMNFSNPDPAAAGLH